jgi:DNA topoisomerase-3
MELDLRVGAIFTRVQTLELQRRLAALAEQLMSYGSLPSLFLLFSTAHFTSLTGPCQFPTLGFVVDQYERAQAFVPEAFWSIHVGLAREDSVTNFSWRRGRLYDHDVATAVFSMCEAEPEATVLSQQTKPTQKWCVSFRPSTIPITHLLCLAGNPSLLPP